MTANSSQFTREAKEMFQRKVALADFIGADARSICLVDERLSVFSAFGGTEAFLVTPGFLANCDPTGQKYGYQIYLLSLGNSTTNA